jgi:phage gpG-like protein
MFTVRLDSKSAIAALSAMPRGLLDAMKDLRKPFRADQVEHARHQEGPDGAWPKRATHAERAQRHRGRRRKRASRRRLLGRLPGAITLRYDRDSIVITSKVAWSAIHQDGGRAGHGAKIPARPFLWVSPRMEKIAIGTIEQALIDRFGRGG